MFRHTSPVPSRLRRASLRARRAAGSPCRSAAEGPVTTPKTKDKPRKVRATVSRDDMAAARQRARDRAGEEALPSKSGRTPSADSH